MKKWVSAIANVARAVVPFKFLFIAALYNETGEFLCQLGG
jgi:hypothetical protein